MDECTRIPSRSYHYPMAAMDKGMHNGACNSRITLRCLRLVLTSTRTTFRRCKTDKKPQTVPATGAGAPCASSVYPTSPRSIADLINMHRDEVKYEYNKYIGGQ